jgi:hypothetical protein
MEIVMHALLLTIALASPALAQFRAEDGTTYSTVGRMHGPDDWQTFTSFTELRVKEGSADDATPALPVVLAFGAWGFTDYLCGEWGLSTPFMTARQAVAADEEVYVMDHSSYGAQHFFKLARTLGKDAPGFGDDETHYIRLSEVHCRP